MTEQNIASPEALLTGEQILAELREDRWRNAEDMSSRGMSRSLGQMDRINNPNVTPTDKNVDFVPYTSVLSPAEVIALEAIGINPNLLAPKLEPQNNMPLNPSGAALVRTNTNGRQQKGNVAVGGANLIVEQEPYETTTFTYRITSEDEVGKQSLRSHLQDQIEATFAASPAYSKVHQAVAETNGRPDAITIKLNINEDPQGVLSVLSDAELFGWSSTQVQTEILQGKLTAKEAIAKAIEERAQKNGTASPDFIKTSFGHGVRHTVFLDRHSSDVSITLEQEPADFYVERANQWHEVSKAFIDTQCAKELFDVLAAQGLTVSESVRHEMTRAGEAARFGSIYTQLTREVAKWIGRPDRTIASNILALQSTSSESEEVDTSPNPEESVRELLLKVQSDAASEPTRVLLAMMQGAVSRADYKSDLPVTNDRVHISEKSCFDIMTYYLIGATNRNIHKHTENNVEMLENTYGVDNYITEQPITFNGVRLPKGALFGKSKNDGRWFFQRLTPFSFDNPDDMNVFGSEVAKAKDIEKASIAELGGFSLAQIVEHAA